MTLPIERARSRRPVTWLTLVGVLLLPVVMGGILVASLYNPVERLDRISAAIVNEDDPVTIDGQMVPLGRQLTAGLVEGSDDVPSNLDWTITNADDAAAGLGDGTYNAVVTIPENFSAAATSSGQALAGEESSAEQATIEIQTSPDAKVVDDAITATVTQTAATVMGTTLSGTTLENVFIGYSTLGDQLGEAASGAGDLADGTQQAADGAAELPGGAAQLEQGAAGLASGASTLSSGLTQIAAGIGDSASGASQIASGARSGAATLRAEGIVPQELFGLADRTTEAAGATTTYAGPHAAALGTLAQECAASGANPDFCAQLTTEAENAGRIAEFAGGTRALAGFTGDALGLFDAQASEELAGRFDQIAAGDEALAGGLTQLADATTQSATGASQLATGATQLGDGLSTYGAGTQTLADALAQLASGSAELAEGLAQAAAAVPVMSDAEAQNVADVLAQPVTTEGLSDNLFGASAIPLLAVVTLWFGGLASYVVLQAASARALTSRRPSVLLAARGFLPAAIVGALQGIAVAAIVQIAAGYDWANWSVFALVCLVAGISFAAVNQALVAVFGGAGRWISALVGALAIATGVVSTMPPFLASLASLVPTAPGYTAMLASLTPASGVAAGLVGLAVWAGLAFLATTIAVARRRTLSARALLAASPA